MQNNDSEPSNRLKLNGKFSSKFTWKTLGFSLLLATQFFGDIQGAEVSEVKTSEQLVLRKWNETPYNKNEVFNILDPILDDEIKDDFLSFITVFFEGFPEPIHSPKAVFNMWNGFFKKLNGQKNIYVQKDDIHPQMKILYAELLCHHYSTLEEKHPHLVKKWLG